MSHWGRRINCILIPTLTHLTDLQRVVPFVTENHVYFRFADGLRLSSARTRSIRKHRSDGAASPLQLAGGPVQVHQFILVDFAQLDRLHLLQVLNPRLENRQTRPRTLLFGLTNLFIDFLVNHLDTLPPTRDVVARELTLFHFECVWQNFLRGRSTSHLSCHFREIASVLDEVEIGTEAQPNDCAAALESVLNYAP